MSCRWPESSQNLPCQVACLCLNDIGVHQTQQSWAQQPKSLRLWPQTSQLGSMGLQPWTQQPKSSMGACWNRGDLPCLSPPHRGLYTHWDGTHTCQCEWLPVGLLLPGWGVSKGPSSSHATICTHVHHAHLSTKLSCPFCPVTFFNCDALKQHGKHTHQTAFLCPN